MNKTPVNHEVVIIFEKGKDPGAGYFRTTGDLNKMTKNEKERNISFREASEIIFGKGRSFVLDKKTHNTNRGKEERITVIGFTKDGRPLLVVFTPRDNAHEKRIISVRQISRKQKAFKILSTRFPILAQEYLKKPTT